MNLKEYISNLYPMDIHQYCAQHYPSSIDTPLYDAITRSDVAAFHRHLPSVADVLSDRRPYLLLACALGHTPIVSALVRKFKQETAARGTPAHYDDLHPPCTCLVYATLHNHYDVVRMLLALGCDPTDVDDPRDIDAVVVAVLWERVRVLGLLLGAPAIRDRRCKVDRNLSPAVAAVLLVHNLSVVARRNREVEMVRNREVEMVRNREVEMVRNREVETVRNREVEMVRNREVEMVRCQREERQRQERQREERQREERQERQERQREDRPGGDMEPATKRRRLE
jgi:hypothetical protein